MQPTPPLVTFLFTDIERSSILWEQHPQAMGRSLAQHDHLMRAAVEQEGGLVFKTMGDAFCVAFERPADAVRAAIRAQRQLAAAAWEETGPLRVRMAVHTGDVERRDGDFFGPTLNRVARILSAGHGGQVLVSGATFDAVRAVLPEDVQLRDLGERRLKDLSRPERLFQCIVPDLPSEFPALRSLEVLPNNLPAQVTRFVGRARELADLKQRLRSTRLITLVGPGGTGKTRLSLQVAADVLEGYPHGVWLVELATSTEADRVPDAVLDALEIRSEPGRAAVDLLVDVLRARKLLLILDNCEHLIAACARMTALLLQRCPEIQILATSREPLNIAGEVLWPVPPLAQPASQEDGEELEYGELAVLESVQLFADRAQAVRPEFTLNEHNARLVAEICRRLDGIPLAIELAAARVKVLPLEQILERLDDRFRLLTGGNRTALPRQQTLGALVEWSYELLTEPERKLLRRLTVFVGGRTLEMIESVCAGDGLEAGQMLDLISSLADKSLVTVEQTSDGAPRYTMLESIWIFAEERLEQLGEAEPFRRRHLECFVALAERAEPELTGPKQKVWLDCLSVENANLNQALRTSATLPGAVESGLRIAAALIRFWEVRNDFLDGYEHLMTLLGKAGPDAGLRLRARAMAGAGRLAWCQDRDELAHQHYSEAQAMFQSLDLPVEVCMTEAFLGFIARNRLLRDEARAHFDRAGNLARQLGVERAWALVVNGRGTLAGDEGRLEEARKWKEEALGFFRRLGDLWVVGLIAGGLGRVCVAQGDRESARRYLHESLTVARELGNKWAVPAVLEVLADLAVLEGQGDRAVRLHGAASALRESFVLSFSPVERDACDCALAELRRRVPPDRFEAEFAAGRSLSLGAAVQLALQ